MGTIRDGARMTSGSGWTGDNGSFAAVLDEFLLHVSSQELFDIVVSVKEELAGAQNRAEVPEGV